MEYFFSGKSCRENENTYFVLNNFFFSKMMPFMKSCGEVFIACQATDDNMAHALCVLDTKGCTHKLRLPYIYCFSIATTVARTCPSVTFYAHCLP